MKDFTPEQVAAQIPQLKAMLAMRNLLAISRPTCWITRLSEKSWKKSFLTSRLVLNCEMNYPHWLQKTLTIMLF
jgi:hypothetical protein